MMNYPFASADWFHESLPKTRLYRRVKASFLTLGHLRTAEALNVAIITGDKAQLVDWGLLITISQYDWRVARKKASKPNFWWIYKRDKNTPRTSYELQKAINWLKSQNYHPTRMWLKAEDKAFSDSQQAFACNRASSAIERLAVLAVSVPSWQTILGVDCIWDAPMIAVTHMLVANAELNGAYHVPYNLIREALNNGKS